MRRREFVPGLGALAGGWPLVGRAQQKAMPVIGFLGSTSPGPFALNMAAFRQGLSETRYVEGKNVALEYRWAEDHCDRLPGLAADLVVRKVNVIPTGSMPSALAAKDATSTIPIVFETGIDPVEAGLVASVARPGGNLTGVCMRTAALMPNGWSSLSELVPPIQRIRPPAEPEHLEEAARAKGVRLEMLRAATENEIDDAFAGLMRLHAGALLVIPDPFLFSRREQLVALASRYAVPAIYPLREFAAVGGLISHAASITAAFHLLGTYAGRVLKGEKPADLPVQQPTTFELVVNLKTAKALVLTVPPSILARADEVIE